MKKSIMKCLVLLSCLAVLLTAALSIAGFYSVYEGQVQQQLRTQVEVIRDSLDYSEDPQEYLEAVKLAAGDIRFTWIDADGTVLFDTDAQASQMENHQDRQEVVAARNKGFGQTTRQSSTLGDRTYYAAYLCDDGSVIRGAIPLRSITNVFVNNLPTTLGIVALMVIVSIPVSRLMTKRLLAPVLAASQSLTLEDANLPEPVYEELEPFFDKIRTQTAQLAANYHHIEQEKSTLSMIISGVREGLILIDGDKNVLSCNDGAISLLQAHAATNYVGHSVLALCREPEFAHAVNQAVHEKESSETVLSVGGLYLRVYVSPAEGVPGAMILIVDSSAQIRAEQQRRDFSANVSHELKTPLTSISGFAEMIESGMAQQKDVRGFAGRIRQEAGRLQFLIDDIMRLSEIEEGEACQEWEPVHLLQIAQDTVETLSIEAREKKVSISCGGEDLVIDANQRMMDELMTNLLSNAVKYNKEGGSAHITVEKQGNMAAILVSDTGIGIPPEHQQRVFERFYRVDKSRSKETGGTGLGLSIVRHIAQVMKGSVILKSQEDVGTEITVLLPFHQEPAGAGSQNGSAGADGPAGAGGHAGSAGADSHNGR